MTQIIPDTTDTIPPEPANQSALYWPETPDTTPAFLVVRDDTAAKTIVPHQPDSHWCLPNGSEMWFLWSEVLEFLAEEELDLADAIWLTPAGAA